MSMAQMQNPHLDSSPFFYRDGPTGVLLIHGFKATPAEVSLVAQYLHQRGYTVAGPRLPGHGTSVEEMNRCSWRDWAEHVAQAYLDLALRCERVFVAGESMGALLTLYLGAEYPGIAGLITYAPALRASSWRIYQALLLQYFIQVRERDQSEEDPDSIVNQRWQGYTGYPVPALVQLLALQRQVKRRLPKIEQPLLVFQGRLDTSIDVRGAEQVIARVSSRDKELVWLAESTHCLILDVEWETAAAKTAAFIQRVEGRTPVQN